MFHPSSWIRKFFNAHLVSWNVHAVFCLVIIGDEFFQRWWVSHQRSSSPSSMQCHTCEIRKLECCQWVMSICCASHQWFVKHNHQAYCDRLVIGKRGGGKVVEAVCLKMYEGVVWVWRAGLADHTQAIENNTRVQFDTLQNSNDENSPCRNQHETIQQTAWGISGSSRSWMSWKGSKLLAISFVVLIAIFLLSKTGKCLQIFLKKLRSPYFRPDLFGSPMSKSQHQCDVPFSLQQCWG